MEFSNKNLQNILKAISSVNHILNEEITLYFISEKVPCTDCALDPILNESTNSFCPVCHGVGWIEDETTLTIPCSINEQLSEEGSIENGKIGKWQPKVLNVTIDILEINKYQVDLKKVKKFEYQGVFYDIDKKIPGVLQGNIYEYDLKLYRLY